MPQITALVDLISSQESIKSLKQANYNKMKTILNLFVAFATIFASETLVSCQEKIVNSDALPTVAQNFIREYFPDSSISYVKKDRELMKTTYEARLQDGTEIDFNSKGEWDSVDCNTKALPAALVPEAIAKYVESSFPGQIIVKIDKEYYGFEIELANDLDLRFDKNGKFLSRDE